MQTERLVMHVLLITTAVVSTGILGQRYPRLSIIARLCLFVIVPGSLIVLIGELGWNSNALVIGSAVLVAGVVLGTLGLRCSGRDWSEHMK